MGIRHRFAFVGGHVGVGPFGRVRTTSPFVAAIVCGCSRACGIFIGWILFCKQSGAAKSHSVSFSLNSFTVLSLLFDLGHSVFRIRRARDTDLVK